MTHILERAFAHAHVAGMSVAVTDANQTIFSEDRGFLSTESGFMTCDGALYRIASISKIVTGLTVMKLAENGQICLDAPIKRYLPKLKLSNAETTQRVTLRHLLSHTAGLPKEYEPDGNREESSLEQAIYSELPEVPLQSGIQDGVFCYSNWGIRLASFVAQEVSGTLFSALADALVLKPLHMDHTTYDPMVAMTYPLSLPHETEGGGFRVVHKINENAARYGAGGLFSNTSDLCKLARMFLRKGINDTDERVFSEKSLCAMKKLHVACDSQYNGYGLTTMHFRHGDMDMVGHLGSHPPYATSLVLDENTGYAVALLMNTYNADARLDIPFELLEHLKKNKA